MGLRSVGLRLVAVAVLAGTAACSDDSDDRSSRVSAATSTTTSSTAPTTTSIAPTTSPAKAVTTTTSPRRSSSPPTTTAPGPAPTTTPSSGPGATTTTTAAPSTTAAPPPSGQGAITIQSFSYNPAVLNVARGTTVTATNLDSTPHTWTSDNRAWDSGNMGQNARASHTFASPGTFPYHCEIHPSMKGTVNVS